MTYKYGIILEYGASGAKCLFMCRLRVWERGSLNTLPYC